MTNGFELHPLLEKESLPVARLGLCELRLMDDRRWPWLLLVPQRPGMVEMHDLTPLDQTTLAFESALAAKALKTLSGADKINVGALGNIVPMLHVHVVARHRGDPAWPGPVWGNGVREPYAEDEARPLVERIGEAVDRR